ncbi:hypothetical protein MLD38_017671 [Melastoma candidum]|uniref:Uncharacterized protein n=1 Tax=Melastoma candidum TaxID=119954 RepID=A0ACB9QSQ2_9MYRT|nr:hypothetical protein MLD38_017671 [Melastoma candidum]
MAIDISIVVLALLSLSPSIVLSDSLLNGTIYETYPLPPGTKGPVTISFMDDGVGPFTGISNGNIVKLNTLLGTYEYFAHAAPNRNNTQCDGNSDPSLYSVCGRPLGNAFNKSNYLYFCDIYFGLNGVGPSGGQATQLVKSAGGQPVFFCNGVSIDPIDGTVYFTDSSQVFKNTTQQIAANDTTGRLLSYEPLTGDVKVLAEGLAGPAGLDVSSNSSYILISEIVSNQIQKFYLKGPKASTIEPLLTNILIPGDIKRVGLGDEFVVPENPTAYVHYAIKINGSGSILANRSISGPYANVLYVRDMQQKGISFFLGSTFATFIGVVTFVAL